jgi:putative SOS response-associated peptidase YedK
VCGRYTLRTPGGRALAERFALTDPDAFDPATLHRFNVCPTEPIAVAVREEDRREVRTMRWGLVPPWAHELGKGFQPINARAETAASKPPFAELFERPERRCLILADGWYEWLKAEKKGGERIPFHYTVDAGEPFAFAGLWGRRRIGGELIHSACILTCAANAVSAPVHDRMPVVLAGPDEEAAWLEGESEGLLGPLDAGRTAVAPANPAVNKAGVEGEELLTPPPDQAPAQLRLAT